MAITKPDQVWASDITYIPLQHGFLYLTAVMDLYSRNVLSWRLSNTLTGAFCREALDAALVKARPEIFNTDQGAQFTATAFTFSLEKSGVAISMDGRGRALDNVFVERLWRTVKYEEVYLRDYVDGWQAEKSLGRYFDFYRNERPTRPLATAPRRRSMPSGDATKTFALKSPLRRTQNEGTSNGTQPVNRLVAARDPW